MVAAAVGAAGGSRRAKDPDLPRPLDVAARILDQVEHDTASTRTKTYDSIPGAPRHTFGPNVGIV